MHCRTLLELILFLHIVQQLSRASLVNNREGIAKRICAHPLGLDVIEVLVTNSTNVSEVQPESNAPLFGSKLPDDGGCMGAGGDLNRQPFPRRQV